MQSNNSKATMWKELRKISRQVQGKENIFGYKSTSANQLYLLYCLCGNIYFTDKIHRQVKLLWLFFVMLELSVCYFAVITNLWYDFKKDFIILLNMMNVIGPCNFIAFMLPMISYWFREGIEAMIKEADEIIGCRLNSTSYEKPKNIKSMKKVVVFNITFNGACLIVTFAYIFDVVLFFETWKMDNYDYYTASIPLIQQFRTKNNYFIFNFFLSLVSVTVLIRYILMLLFLIHWSLTCHNELMHVANELNVHSNHLDECLELEDNPSAVWNQNFNLVLIRNIRQFQKIITMIENFRGFYQVFCAIGIPTGFLATVAQLYLYITLTGNSSPALQLKSIAYCLINGWVIGQEYWAAQLLETSVFEVSQTIYYTPWYRSIEPRKNVYIFLCQTHKFKPLKILKLHSLLMPNFSRYLNRIWSVTNVLLKTTQ